jgi:hypothetical protein
MVASYVCLSVRLLLHCAMLSSTSLYGNAHPLIFILLSTYLYVFFWIAQRCMLPRPFNERQRFHARQGRLSGAAGDVQSCSDVCCRSSSTSIATFYCVRFLGFYLSGTLLSLLLSTFRLHGFQVPASSPNLPTIIVTHSYV